MEHHETTETHDQRLNDASRFLALRSDVPDPIAKTPGLTQISSFRQPSLVRLFFATRFHTFSIAHLQAYDVCWVSSWPTGASE